MQNTNPNTNKMTLKHEKAKPKPSASSPIYCFSKRKCHQTSDDDHLTMKSSSDREFSEKNEQEDLGAQNSWPGHQFPSVKTVTVH